MSTESRPDIQAIRELAYRLWEADGRRHGTADDYWLQAERQLAAGHPPTAAAAPRAVDDSIKQSFPASDPPASRLPDEPPVNAEAKWEAAAKAKGKAAPSTDGTTSTQAGSNQARSTQARPTRGSALRGGDPKRTPH